MKTTWHAVLRFKGPGVTEHGAETTLAGSVEELLETLDALSPVASLGHKGLQLALAIDEADAPNAAGRVVDRVTRALIESGIGDCELAYVSLQEWSDFEAELEEPTHPPLVGIAEIARMAGVTRQRASKLARSSAFPKPHARLSSGPVWLKPNVVRFVDAWERKPGRPRLTEERISRAGTG